MTDARLRLFWHRAGPPVAVVALVAAGVASQGCGGGGNNNTGGAGGSTSSSTSTSTTTTTSSSTTTSSTTTSSTTTSSGGTTCAPASFGSNIAAGANGGFSDPFDAHPSSDGCNVFFTAIDANANAGVFKQSLSGGTAMALYTGGEFVAPFGVAVSSDDMTVFVSDPGALANPTDPTTDMGVIFKLSAAGGSAPTHLVDSVQPRSLTVVAQGNADVIYFTGTDKATGKPGVFSVPAAGGTPTTIASGPPFNEPAGLAVTAAGTIYVLDASGSASGLGNIIVVTGGTATEFVPDLQVGYPAGIALMKDDSMLLASGMDPAAQSNILFQVTVASKMVNPNTNVVGKFNEAAGLHRAHNADVFAWADTKATPSGMTGTGTVFVIK